ncbi:MAG: inorganic phosphate transporter, partial [Methylococcaceae bacterium]|nr:inorganic phosphate transporter [Methylococcaceae bacterium]
MVTREFLTSTLAGAILWLVFSTVRGWPVSTTHVSTGSLIGVRWSRKSKPYETDAMCAIVWAWVVTLPASAIISAVFLGLLTV